MRKMLSVLFLAVFTFIPPARSEMAATPLNSDGEGLSKISAEEFIENTSKHVERISFSAQWAAEKYPEHFGLLDSDLIFEYFNQVHDIFKLYSLNDLRQLDLRSTDEFSVDESFAEFFARYNNVSRKTLAGKERRKFDFMISELNRLESERAALFFSSYNMTTEQIEQLMLLDNIVDIVDTKVFRTHEMGEGLEVFASTVWILSTENKMTTDLGVQVMVATSLEKNLNKIYGPNTLDSSVCMTILKDHARLHSKAN